MPPEISTRLLAVHLIGDLLGSRIRAALPSPDGSPPEQRNERFASEIAHGVVRHLARLDWIIAAAAGKPVSRIAPPALTAARIGVYQLLFTVSVPAYAAVSTSVELAKALSPKTAGFVNWLLRRVPPDVSELPRRADFADEIPWLAAHHSFPPWLVRRWAARFGTAEAGSLMAAMNTHPPPHLRANRLRAVLAAVREELAGDGFAATPGRFAPDALHVHGAGPLTGTPLFRSGAIYLQDESSQLAALALAPRPGERILDACAGVGGKTTQIAELAGGGAKTIALDRDAGRLARLEQNARRLVTPGIEARLGDLLAPATLAGESFDAVLLDAPCSALGTIPRHPEVKWSKRASDPKRLAELQLRLLSRSADLLAPGGRIVYSTCSTEPEEGEQVVARFLGERRKFSVVDLGAPGNSQILDAAQLRTKGGFLRTWPHRHGVGGAFVALLVDHSR